MALLKGPGYRTAQPSRRERMLVLWGLVFMFSFLLGRVLKELS